MDKRKLLIISGKRDPWVTPTDIPASEAAVLRDFYNKTGGASWTNNTNWGKTNTASSWYGITLKSGHVQIMNLSNNHLVGNITGWNLGALTAIEDIYFQTNTSLTGDISTWTFSNLFENVQIYNTGLSGDISGWIWPNTVVAIKLYNSSVSGDISRWVLPSSLQHIVLNTTSVSGDISGWVLPGGALFATFEIAETGVSGNISSWVIPVGLKYFYLFSTLLTGSPIFSSSVAIEEILAHSCGTNHIMTQADVDTWVSKIYARRASFTHSTPVLYLHGTNSAPSGTYADEDPPTTGKGFIYKLKNDPEAEGFYKWTINYNA